MKFECEQDINYLIEKIGNANFCSSFDLDKEYQHEKHPNVVRIWDCEFESCIDVSSGLGKFETEIMARSLVILLNQYYNELKQ